MPIKKIHQSTVPAWLKGGDLQTIFPPLFRWEQTDYERERVETPDQDFLDLDWVKNNSKRLVILSHGLEGNSDGEYIKGMANFLKDKNFDILAWNYRGRSGEPNKQVYSYHAGFTADLKFLAERYSDAYQEIFLVGFSLGGCITLNYLGKHVKDVPSNVKAAVAISAPLELSSSCDVLDKARSLIYRRYFLMKLAKSVYAKSKAMPGQVELRPMLSIHKIRQFDETYTAPINGFESAQGYYEAGSPIHQLAFIKKPTLILNAYNDPILSEACYPEKIQGLPANVHYHISQDGGHVGFSKTDKTGGYFSDRYALHFINEQSGE